MEPTLNDLVTLIHELKARIDGLESLYREGAYQTQLRQPPPPSIERTGVMEGSPHVNAQTIARVFQSAGIRVEGLDQLDEPGPNQGPLPASLVKPPSPSSTQKLHGPMENGAMEDGYGIYIARYLLPTGFVLIWQREGKTSDPWAFTLKVQGPDGAPRTYTHKD